MMTLKPLTDLNPRLLETTPLLRKTASAGRRLAELKGMSSVIPNQGMLVYTLEIQEAKYSSEIENIITTHDEIFRHGLVHGLDNSTAAKEVRRYVEALRVGYKLVNETKLLTGNYIQLLQETLGENSAGYRKLPGTALKNSFGETVYTPPQDYDTIVRLMSDLEQFINDDSILDADPLIKMAIIHYQFESIHPFYDGNGRTGRIINILYLIQQGLLDLPTLYMSRHITRTKSVYYQLLQSVREDDGWEKWVLYMLTVIEETAIEALSTVSKIADAFRDYKHRIKTGHKFYSLDLINNLFTHPTP